MRTPHHHPGHRPLAAAITVVAVLGLVAAMLMAPDRSDPVASEPSSMLHVPMHPVPPRIVPYSPAAGATAALTQPPSARAATAHPRPAVSIYKRVHWTFDSGSSGWAGGFATGLRTTHAPVENGAGALSLHNGGSSTQTITASSGSSATRWTPARPGMRVFGSASVRAASKGRIISVSVAFLTAQGRRIDGATGQALSDGTHGWSQSYNAVGIAPPGTAYAVVQVTVTGAAPGETHYIDNAALLEYPGSSRNVAGPLHTEDNQVIDADGHTLVLRGFTRVGLEGADASAPTQDDIAHAKAWGANIIRLPLGEQFWLTSSCHHRSNYVAQVDSAVRMVTGLGMVALLDLHWNSLRPCGSYGQQPMADSPGSITFWQQVAARYKNNPLVAFDLYNEPHDISDAVWRFGGPVTWKGVHFTAAGMQQMYAAVRGTGATNLVIATGNSWGNLFPATAPLSGLNVVYGVHAYTCSLRPPPNCDNGAPYDPSQYLQFWDGPGQTVPVAVTEFGWPNPDDGRYMNAVLAYAEDRGWGWTAFTWGSASWGPFSLLANAGPGRAYEPRPTGEAVLAAFPGA